MTFTVWGLGSLFPPRSLLPDLGDCPKGIPEGIMTFTVNVILHTHCFRHCNHHEAEPKSMRARLVHAQVVAPAVYFLPSLNVQVQTENAAERRTAAWQPRALAVKDLGLWEADNVALAYSTTALPHILLLQGKRP